MKSLTLQKVFKNDENIMINCKKNHEFLLSSLNALKIEEVLESYINIDLLLIYNGKVRSLGKKPWLKLIGKTLLNKYTKILQFKIENIEMNGNETMFDIFLICRKQNGNLFFTELNFHNKWKNNLIQQITYTSKNH